MRKHLQSLTLVTAAALEILTGCSSYSYQSSEDVFPPSPAALPSAKQHKVYSNNFFEMIIPDNWEAVSQDGPDIPAFVSARRKDHKGLVSIKVSSSHLSTDELCNHTAKGLVVNSADITKGPAVEFGKCLIQFNTIGRSGAFWARRFEDGTVYSIYFEGNLDTVSEILGSTSGNERFMSLLVMPLQY